MADPGIDLRSKFRRRLDGRDDLSSASWNPNGHSTSKRLGFRPVYAVARLRLSALVCRLHIWRLDALTRAKSIR